MSALLNFALYKTVTCIDTAEEYFDLYKSVLQSLRKPVRSSQNDKDSSPKSNTLDGLRVSTTSSSLSNAGESVLKNKIIN